MSGARTVLVQYRVKSDRASENEAFVRRVFDALEKEKPNGVRYVSFKAVDGVSFTHLAIVETDDGRNPVVALEAFRNFTATIRDRCEVPPQSTDLVQLGAYRIFEGGRAEGPC